MSTLQEQYQQLLADLKQYITAEYPAGSWINSDQENFTYFKQYALQKRKSQEEHQKPQLEIKPQSATPLSKLEVNSSQLAPKMENNFLPHSKPAIQASPTVVNKALEMPAEVYAAPVAKNVEKIAKDQKPPLFKREPALPAIEEDFSDIRQFFAKNFPHILLHSTPPKDDMAKAFINQWQQTHADARVLILSFSESAKEKLFLSNLRHALELEFGSAIIYAADKAERQASWKELLASKQLALIIAHKGKMEALSGLMANYREEPVPMLGKVHVYPLCDISLYIQEPILKIALWNALATFLSKT